MFDLACVPQSEQEEFFNSFDDVLCDVDGVIWFVLQKFPGSDDAIRYLRCLGKRVVFVSNNSTKSCEIYLKQLNSMGFPVGPFDLVIPTLAIIDYLKCNNFEKEAFVLGTNHFKQELRDAGIKVYESLPDRVEESIFALVKVIQDDERIGAVIADMDINLNYVNLQKAVTCLKRKDVLFISGASDAEAPAGPNTILIGPKYFHQALEEVSKRQKFSLAKPSLNLNKFIVKKYNIQDPSRVLFIGDSVPEDMGFATNCGYKKLLVLSGLTTPEALHKWTWPNEFKPEYYVSSLKVLADLLARIKG